MENTTCNKVRTFPLNVYIAPLQTNTTESDIDSYFNSHGVTLTNINLLKKKNTNLCKGFAFVEISPDSNIQNLSEKKEHFILNRRVFLHFFSSKEELEEKREITNKKRVFVSNIPSNMSNDDLKFYFSKFGVVLSGYRIKNHKSKRLMPYGYLFFENEESATACVRTHKIFFNDQHGFMYAEPYIQDRKAKEFFKKQRKNEVQNDQKFLKKSHHAKFKENSLNDNNPKNLPRSLDVQSSGYDNYKNRGEKIEDLGYRKNHFVKEENRKISIEFEGRWILISKNELRNLKRKIREEVEFHSLKPTEVRYWLHNLWREKYLEKNGRDIRMNHPDDCER